MGIVRAVLCASMSIVLGHWKNQVGQLQHGEISLLAVSKRVKSAGGSGNLGRQQGSSKSDAKAAQKRRGRDAKFEVNTCQTCRWQRQHCLPRGASKSDAKAAQK